MMVLRISSLVTWSVYEIQRILRKHLISTAAIFLCSYAVMVHDSHAYRKMERTGASTSFILDFSEMFLSLQIGLSLTNAVNVCADLAKISILDPSSLMMAPRYLNCFTVSSSCPLAVMRDLIVLLLFVIIQLVHQVDEFFFLSSQLYKYVKKIKPKPKIKSNVKKQKIFLLK